MTTNTQEVTVQPGDVVVDQDGKRAVVDGSYFGTDFEDGKGPVVMTVYSASAFRGRDRSLMSLVEDGMTGAGKRGGETVSCSGGPCPMVPISELTYVGETEQRFWHWKDGIARAHNGVDYTATVAMWRRESASA